MSLRHATRGLHPLFSGASEHAFRTHPATWFPKARICSLAVPWLSNQSHRSCVFARNNFTLSAWRPFGLSECSNRRMLSSMAARPRNHYEVLGIGPTATLQEVKEAYRKKAMQHHPDRAEGCKKVAEEAFKEISEAHAVLSDTAQRRGYDAMSDSSARRFNARGTPWEEVFRGYEKHPEDEVQMSQEEAEEIMEMLLREAGPHGRGKGRKRRRGRGRGRRSEFEMLFGEGDFGLSFGGDGRGGLFVEFMSMEMGGMGSRVGGSGNRGRGKGKQNHPRKSKRRPSKRAA